MDKPVSRSEESNRIDSLSEGNAKEGAALSFHSIFESIGDIGHAGLNEPRLAEPEPLKYSLPGDAHAAGNGNTLADLDSKIKDKATANVQSEMTQQEKDQLAKDAKAYTDSFGKYWKEAQAYEEAAKRYGMLDCFGCRAPQPPALPKKPESVKQYESRIDAEVGKIARRLQDNI